MSFKKSTVLQISSLNKKTGSKSEIKWKMQLIQSNSFSEFKKKCETVILIFKHRKGLHANKLNLLGNV